MDGTLHFHLVNIYSFYGWRCICFAPLPRGERLNQRICFYSRLEAANCTEKQTIFQPKFNANEFSDFTRKLNKMVDWVWANSLYNDFKHLHYFKWISIFHFTNAIRSIFSTEHIYIDQICCLLFKDLAGKQIIHNLFYSLIENERKKFDSRKWWNSLKL